MPETTATAPASEQQASAAAPQSTPNAPPPQAMEDVYGEFDAIESGSKPAPKKESARPAPKPASSAKEPSRETGSESSPDSPPDKSPESSQESAKDASASSEPKPVKAAVLRDAYEKLKRDHNNLKAEHEKLKTAPADEGRVKQLQELLDSERKARAEIEKELKFTAYEKSQEFKDKYQKPYVEAYAMGRRKAASLKVVARTDDLGDEVSPARQGTEADFDEIMRIQDDDAASEKAIELFGPKAQMVLYYRERVQELHSASQTAINEFRTNSEQREKEMAETKTRQESEAAQQAKTQAEAFRKEVEAGVKAHPELFQAIDGDEVSAEVLKRGQAVADSLFSGINPRTGKPYTPEGLVKFHAFTRNALAAHGHLMHKLKLAQTRVEELESDLKEYKQSGTSQDSGRTESSTRSGLPGDEEFDEADARSGRRW